MSFRSSTRSGAFGSKPIDIGIEFRDRILEILGSGWHAVLANPDIGPSSKEVTITANFLVGIRNALESCSEK